MLAQRLGLRNLHLTSVWRLCAAGTVYLVELGRRLTASHPYRWDGEDQQQERIELRGQREVEELEAWATWLWLFQQLLLWPCLLSKETTKTCEDSNLFSQMLERQSRSLLKLLFGWQKA